MSYRTILIPAAGQGHDHEALTVACDLARHFDGEVRVLPCAPDPAASMSGYYDVWGGGGLLSAEYSSRLEDAYARIDAVILTASREAAARSGIGFGEQATGPHALLVAAGATPRLTLLKEAPFGDLFVIARKAAVGAAELSSLFTDALMDLRLPILIANGSRPAGGGTAVLAWNGSMEAGRAMRAAMPLLRAARKVVVVQHKASLEWEQEDAAALQRCMTYLSRHKVQDLESLRIEIAGDQGAVLQTVKDMGADLLVAGAYGHPRWQETLFGGFTRALLQDEECPHVLVSH